MYKLNFLKKENNLNKVIGQQKRSKSNLSILFVSLWDKPSINLVEKLKAKYEDSEEGEDLYIVNSFAMPHSFVIYNTTKLPHLVRLKRNVVVSKDYYPIVLHSLGIT